MKTILTLLLLGFGINTYSSDYFPLEIGNRWVWISYPSINETPGEITLEILRDSIVGDTTFYISHQSCIMNGSGCGSFDDIFFVTESNLDAIYAYEEGLATEFFQHSFQDGDSTYIFGEKVKVEYIGTVSVAAGTFDSCYKAGIDVFAPNVGLIATCWDENCEEPYQQELLEYNIASITSIENLNSDIEINIFPNPAKDFILIEHATGVNISSIRIMDMQGSVWFKTTDSFSNLDLSYLNKGLYLLEIGIYDRKRQLFKILKQ